MHGRGDGSATGVRVEGHAQDVWGLQWCHPLKGKERMGDEGFGGQIEKTVGYSGAGHSQYVVGSPEGDEVQQAVGCS